MCTEIHSDWRDPPPFSEKALEFGPTQIYRQPNLSVSTCPLPPSRVTCRDRWVGLTVYRGRRELLSVTHTDPGPLLFFYN